MIKGVQVTRSSNAIILAVTGYSTVLEVTLQASFTFSARSRANRFSRQPHRLWST